MCRAGRWRIGRPQVNQLIAKSLEPTALFTRCLPGTSHLATPLSEATLGFVHMAAEYNRVREGGIYCICFSNNSALSVFGQILLQSRDRRPATLLVGEADLVGVLEVGWGVAGDNRAHKAFAISPMGHAALRVLTKDLDRALRPRHRVIVLAIRASGLPADAAFRQYLLQWRRWLGGNGCVLLIALLGEEPLVLTQQMMAHNEYLSGVSCLRAEDNQWHYEVRYWCNQVGVSGGSRFSIQAKDGAFIASPRTFLDSVRETDSTVVLLERRALLELPLRQDTDWQVFEEPNQLLDRALTAHAATVIFACEGRQALPQLARWLYRLRLVRGPRLKLLIREVGGELRDQDVELLLSCGATWLLPRRLLPTQMMHFLTLARGFKHTRPLLENLEDHLAWRWGDRIAGVVLMPDFLDYLQQLLSNMRGLSGQGVLVVLQPAPGLSPSHILTQLNLQRAGDAAAALAGQIYLFLAGCRPEFVAVALKAVFSLDYRELVTSHEVCADHGAISDKLEVLRQTPADRVDPALEYTQMLSTPGARGRPQPDQPRLAGVGAPEPERSK